MCVSHLFFTSAWRGSLRTRAEREEQRSPKPPLKRTIAPSLRARESVCVRTMYICVNGGVYTENQTRSYMALDMKSIRGAFFVWWEMRSLSTRRSLWCWRPSTAKSITSLLSTRPLPSTCPLPFAHILRLGLAVWAASMLLRAIENVTRQGIVEQCARARVSGETWSLGVGSA